ncbi:MAG: hypothetical protein Kow00121_06760 [Elainellaceae cyanobacterium]
MLRSFQSFLSSLPVQKATFPFHKSEGKVDKVVEPGKVWRVCHNATFWFARSHKRINLYPGDWVKIVGRDGIVLFIEPMDVEEQ